MLNKRNRVVTKHNGLVTSRHGFSVMQNRIFSTLLTKISPEDVELNKYYTIHVSEICDTADGARQDMYTRIRSEIRKMQSKHLYIKTSNGNELDVTLIASAEYNKRGTVEIEISQKLKPYLIKIAEQGHFTKYVLGEMLTLKSIYAQRLYENLCKWRSTGQWMVSVEDLRDMMELQGKYKGYGMFKKRVILRAQAELEHTEMAFNFYEVGKEGKQIKTLRFELKGRKQLKIGEDDQKIYERLMGQFSLSDWQARMIVKHVDRTVIGTTLYEINLQKSDKTINSMGAYTWSSFKNQYPEVLGGVVQVDLFNSKEEKQEVELVS